jgi:hypothetical protein
LPAGAGNTIYGAFSKSATTEFAKTRGSLNLKKGGKEDTISKKVLCRGGTASRGQILPGRCESKFLVNKSKGGNTE